MAFNLLTSSVTIEYRRLKCELHQSIYNFSEHVDLLRANLLLSKSEINQRQQLAQIIECVINRSQNFNGKIYVYGSTANSLGFKDSDLDINFELTNSPVHVVSEDGSTDQINHATNTLGAIREELLKSALFEVVSKPKKNVYRVPTIILQWPKQRNSISCDIAVTAGHAVHHARIISHFSQIEPLFKDLAMLTLAWMKNSKMINFNRLNTLSAILMVVFYMQRQQLLPSVRSLQAKPSTYEVINYQFDANLSWKSPVGIKPSISDLFINFFTFYANFDYRKVISTNYGIELAKSDLLQVNEDFTQAGFVIQDPFDLRYVMTKKMTKAFVSELVATFRSLSKIALDFQQYDGQNAPINMLHYLIDSNVIISRIPRNRKYLNGTLFV